MFDECGNCGGTETAGCTDSNACNYDASASCDDGTCLILDECGVCGGSGTLGCTHIEACNYDPAAACDDGSCILGPASFLDEYEISTSAHDATSVFSTDLDGDGDMDVLSASRGNFVVPERCRQHVHVSVTIKV